MTLLEYIKQEEQRAQTAESVTLPIDKWRNCLHIMRIFHVALTYTATERNPNLYECIDKAMNALAEAEKAKNQT